MLQVVKQMDHAFPLGPQMENAEMSARSIAKRVKCCARGDLMIMDVLCRIDVSG